MNKFCRFAANNNVLQQFKKKSTKATNTTSSLIPKQINKNEIAKTEYDPKQVTKEDMQWRTPWHITEGQHYRFLRTFYKEGSNRKLLKLLQTSIDLSPSSVRKWLEKKKYEREAQTQSYIPERHQMLGNELAAAHFIVYRGGAVKFFNEDIWIKADDNKEYSLPSQYEPDKHLQAIDCTDMNLYYEGLINLDGLKQLEWLSLNGCEKMDDWCMDKISNIFSHSLIYLDIRNCPNISEKGIGALYKLRNLKILYMDDFLRSTTYELTCLLLQEVNPDLEIMSDPIVF